MNVSENDVAEEKTANVKIVVKLLLYLDLFHRDIIARRILKFNLIR